MTDLKSHFCRKKVTIASLCTQRCYGRHKFSRKSFYRFYCMALFYSQTRRHNYDKSELSVIESKKTFGTVF